MFSVVIPLYNKELSIKNTIQSVLDQSFQDFEIIIVNDGSTDKSADVVEQFTDSRIKLIHQENQGVSAARNRGIKDSKFEWICFLDADDLWKEKHLYSFVEMIENYPEHKVFCNSYRLSNKKNQTRYHRKDIKVVNDYFAEAIKYHFFWTGVVCIHKSLFYSIGYFNTQLSRGEDLDVWMRIGRNYSIIWGSEVTAVYNQEAENKVTLKKTSLDNSVIYYLDFVSKSTSEKSYSKQIILNKIKSLLLHMEIKDALKLVIKYNLKLL